MGGAQPDYVGAERSSADWALCKTRRTALARPDEGVRAYVSIVVNDFPYAKGRALSKRNGLEPRYVFSISRTFSIPSVSMNFTSITSFMVVATVRPTKSAAIGNSR
jgi:hypothetical protein